MPAYDPLNPTKEAPRYVPEPIKSHTLWQLQYMPEHIDEWSDLHRWDNKDHALSYLEEFKRVHQKRARLVRVETKTYVES